MCIHAHSIISLATLEGGKSPKRGCFARCRYVYITHSIVRTNVVPGKEKDRSDRSMRREKEEKGRRAIVKVICHAAFEVYGVPEVMVSVRSKTRKSSLSNLLYS